MQQERGQRKGGGGGGGGEYLGFRARHAACAARHMLASYPIRSGQADSVAYCHGKGSRTTLDGCRCGGVYGVHAGCVQGMRGPGSKRACVHITLLRCLPEARHAGHGGGTPCPVAVLLPTLFFLMQNKQALRRQVPVAEVGQRRAQAKGMRHAGCSTGSCPHKREDHVLEHLDLVRALGAQLQPGRGSRAKGGQPGRR